MVRALTFDRFDAGIDLRKSGQTSDANRMQDLLNCDVTNGYAISKRPGLRFNGSLPENGKGLFAVGNTLKTITGTMLASSPPDAVYGTVIAGGYVYASVKTNGATRHYYLDSGDLFIPESLQTELFNAAAALSAFINAAVLPSFATQDYSYHKQQLEKQEDLANGVWSVSGGRAALYAGMSAVIVGRASAVDLGNIPGGMSAAAVALSFHACAVALDALVDLTASVQCTAFSFHSLIRQAEEDFYIGLEAFIQADPIVYPPGTAGRPPPDHWRLKNFIINNGGTGSTFSLAYGAGSANMYTAINALAQMSFTVLMIDDMHHAFVQLQAAVSAIDGFNETNGEVFNNALVTDANCPNGKHIISLAGKIFSPSLDGKSVRFSATNNPKDWTTADDAGFLPISHNGGGLVSGLGIYRGMLAVFTDAAVQIWKVDPDPAQHALVDIAHGVGTQFPFSISSVSGDVIFISPAGVRSLSQAANSGNLSDVDIGSPVDALVKQILARNAGAEVIGHYSQSLGKLLLFVGREVLVYSFSKTSKLAAWSRWVLPGVVTAVTDMLGNTYVRIGNKSYVLAYGQYTDDGVVFECRADMAFLALKAPGSTKRLMGCDASVQGACSLFIGSDESDVQAEFPVADLEGDSRPFGTIPVELHGTAFAPRFRAAHGGKWQIDLLTLYYDVMGVR